MTITTHINTAVGIPRTQSVSTILILSAYHYPKGYWSLCTFPKYTGPHRAITDAIDILHLILTDMEYMYTDR